MCYNLWHSEHKNALYLLSPIQLGMLAFLFGKLVVHGQDGKGIDEILILFGLNSLAIIPIYFGMRNNVANRKLVPYTLVCLFAANALTSTFLLGYFQIACYLFALQAIILSLFLFSKTKKLWFNIYFSIWALVSIPLLVFFGNICLGLLWLSPNFWR